MMNHKVSSGIQLLPKNSQVLNPKEKKEFESLNKARKYLEMGDYQNSVNEYHRYLAFSPTPFPGLNNTTSIFEANYHLGVIYSLQNDHDLALKYLKVALQNTHEHHQEIAIKLLAGKIFFLKGDSKSAQEALQTIADSGSVANGLDESSNEVLYIALGTTNLTPEEILKIHNPQDSLFLDSLDETIGHFLMRIVDKDRMALGGVDYFQMLNYYNATDSSILGLTCAAQCNPVSDCFEAISKGKALVLGGKYEEAVQIMKPFEKEILDDMELALEYLRILIEIPKEIPHTITALKELSQSRPDLGEIYLMLGIAHFNLIFKKIVTFSRWTPIHGKFAEKAHQSIIQKLKPVIQAYFKKALSAPKINETQIEEAKDYLKILES